MLIRYALDWILTRHGRRQIIKKRRVLVVGHGHRSGFHCNFKYLPRVPTKPAIRPPLDPTALLTVRHMCGTFPVMSAVLFGRQVIEGKMQRVHADPSYPAMLEFVRAVDGCVVSSASAAGIVSERLPILRNVILHDAFSLCFPETSIQTAVDRLNNVFGQIVFQSETTTFSTHFLSLDMLPLKLTLDLDPLKVHRFQECLANYSAAVLAVVSEQVNSIDGREILRRLMANLQISFDELGRMFGVAGETVRRWQTGFTPIPNERNELITRTQQPLAILLEIFRPVKLPQVIRRPAKLFGGECALDWILRGKIKEVANRYELALRYQA